MSGGERHGRTEAPGRSTVRASDGRFAFWSVAARRVPSRTRRGDGLALAHRKRGGAGDGKVFDTEVDPEDRSVLGGVPFGVVLVPAKADMQEELAVTGSERTFRNTLFVQVEIVALVAIVGVGKVERTPNPALRRGEGHGIVIEHRRRPRIVLHRGCSERRLADLLAVRPGFDTASDGSCGLVGGKNRVLTTEAGIIAHRIVSEGLHVAFGATCPTPYRWRVGNRASTRRWYLRATRVAHRLPRGG